MKNEEKKTIKELLILNLKPLQIICVQLQYNEQMQQQTITKPKIIKQTIIFQVLN